MSEQGNKQLDKLKINKETIADLDVDNPEGVKGGRGCESKNPVSCDPATRIGCPEPSVYCSPKPIVNK